MREAPLAKRTMVSPLILAVLFLLLRAGALTYLSKPSKHTNHTIEGPAGRMRRRKS